MSSPSGARGCASPDVSKCPSACTPFLAELREETGPAFDCAARAPSAQAGWSAARASLLPALAATSLPGAAAVLIAEDDGPAPGWAAAVQAGFLPAPKYFAPVA